MSAQTSAGLRLSSDDELTDAQREAERSRTSIEETLSRIQTKIDRSTENVRSVAMTPLRVAGDRPLAFTAVFFLAGLVVGMLSKEEATTESPMES